MRASFFGRYGCIPCIIDNGYCQHWRVYWYQHASSIGCCIRACGRAVTTWWGWLSHLVALAGCLFAYASPLHSVDDGVAASYQALKVVLAIPNLRSLVPRRTCNLHFALSCCQPQHPASSTAALCLSADCNQGLNSNQKNNNNQGLHVTITRKSMDSTPCSGNACKPSLTHDYTLYRDHFMPSRPTTRQSRAVVVSKGKARRI